MPYYGIPSARAHTRARCDLEGSISRKRAALIISFIQYRPAALLKLLIHPRRIHPSVSFGCRRRIAVAPFRSRSLGENRFYRAFNGSPLEVRTSVRRERSSRAPDIAPLKTKRSFYRAACRENGFFFLNTLESVLEFLKLLLVLYLL